MNTQTYLSTLVKENCCNCGVTFGIEAEHHKEFLNDRTRNFYCPNGHPQHYSGQTEAQKLKDQLAAERARADQDRARYQENTGRLYRRLSATQGVVTRIKKRVGAGLCTCCKRYFHNLHRHMQTKHKESV